MSSPKILILMGVSGSGKTEIGQRLATELDWSFFDGDNFHPPENIAKMSQSMPLTDADRSAWLEALQGLIGRRLDTHQSAVIACSALKQTYRDRLRLDPSVKFIYLKGSYELINQRLKKRTDHYMPSDLLASQFETLEEPQEALVVDVAQPPEEIIRTIQEKFFNSTENTT